MSGTNVIGVQIPANEALSGEIDLGEFSMLAFEMPEAWAGAALTFQSKAKRNEDPNPSADEVLEDWDNVYDDNGTELSITVAANRVVGLRKDQASILSALRYLRIRSGTSAAPVNQNPAKDIRIICKA